MATTIGTGQAIGKVFILQGTVKAIAPDGMVRMLGPNSVIFADERIITESDGNVSIMLDGPPPAQIDLGRMSDVHLNEDVYAGATPEVVKDASTEAADAEKIQQSLLEGDQPIELEATAAGGAAGAGGMKIASFALDGAEGLVSSGAETTGVGFGTVNTLQGVTEVETAAPTETPAVPPVAAPDAVTVAEGHTLTVSAEAGVLANDTASAGGLLAVAHTYEGNLGGHLVLHADGSYEYTAPVLHIGTEQEGTETFTYTITDANGSISTSTLTINITDTVPTGSTASYELAEGTTASYIVPGGTGVDSPVTVVDGKYFGSHGTEVTVVNGIFSYTAPVLHVGTTQEGTETFTFDLHDVDGSKTTSTVTFTIDDTGPVAHDDHIHTNSDGIATGNVITGANEIVDTNHPGADTLNVDSPFHLTVDSTQGQYGTLTIDTTDDNVGIFGQYTYHNTTTPTAVSQDVDVANGPVTAYGFLSLADIKFGTDGHLLDANPGQYLDEKGNIEHSEKSGIGVNNPNPGTGSNAVDHGEAILLDLHQNTTTVDVNLSQFNSGQNAQNPVTWYAYNASGQQVDTGLLTSLNPNGDPVTFTIKADASFDRLVLQSASETQEGFVLQSIEVHNQPVTDTFHYTLTDFDGSHSSADLTIDTSHDLLVTLVDPDHHIPT